MSDESKGRKIGPLEEIGRSAAHIQGSQEAVQKAIPVALDFSTLLEDIRAGRVSREAALARIAELQAQIRQAEDPLPYGPIQLEGQPPPDSGKP